MQIPSLTIVIPVYNSANTLPTLISRIKSSLSGERLELILVDDCSSDDSWNVLKRLASDNPEVLGIRLATNSGQHAALLAGIRKASASVIVTIDDDLQNPPEEIPLLLAELTPDWDVVYGTTRQIRHSLFRRLMGRTARNFFRIALGVQHSQTSSSFRAFRAHLRDGFAGDLGPDISLDALLGWSTSRFTAVNVRHHKRVHGASHYNARKLLDYFVDSITGYSTIPLKLATRLGIMTLTLALGILLYVLVTALFGSDSIPGFPFLAASIAIFAGTQLVVLGIIGQYIGRMHYRVMNKPTYTIAESTSALTR